MRTVYFPTFVASAILAIAFIGCSSSSDSDSGSATPDSGLPGEDAATQDAGPDGSAPDTGQDAVAEAGKDAPTEASNDDIDGDGIPNDQDACPNEPEDLDGWEDDDGCPDPEGNDGPLPSIPSQSGVVYAIHFHSGELFWYRIDGATPRKEGDLDMEEVSHDAALDPVHDLLYVAHDAAKKVEVYQLGRPANASSDTPTPQLLSTIDFSEPPYFVRVNPHRDRLYVLQSLPGSGGTVTEAALFIYDVTDPGAPSMVDGSPHTIPSTASFDIDAARDLLFLYHGPDSTLHGFDLHGDDVEPLPGGAIDLEALYPQDNSWGFQARNLTVDLHANRIYAARPQGGLSEVIALSYPADVPVGGAAYGDYAEMSDLSVVADPFDVDLPLDQRPHLLDAFTPVPDPELDALFFVGSTWNGTAATSMVLSMPGTLDAIDTGCSAFEDFGCWYRSYSSSTPNAFMRTDGAACADFTQQVFVGSSVDALDETNPGLLHFFQYDGARNLDVWLPDDGGDVLAGALPISLMCH